MQAAVLLAIAASFCTATASLAQRQGAKSVQTTGGFDTRLLLRLARQPVWLLGIGSMIGGFVFQLTALRYGPLALVQPILALELLLVFGFLAFAGRRQTRIKPRDWLGAAAMSAGVAVFLRLASASGGRLHAAGSSWLLAGLVTLGVVLAAVAVAFGMGNRPGATPSRRAAILGSATGIAWGFVAAVIKELSSHLGGGLGAVFWPHTRWRPGRSPHHSRGSPSSTRSRPACSASSCSVSGSRPDPGTWRARRWLSRSSSPAPRSSAIAALSAARRATRPACQPASGRGPLPVSARRTPRSADKPREPVSVPAMPSALTMCRGASRPMLGP
jgi:hypothetical protein